MSNVRSRFWVLKKISLMDTLVDHGKLLEVIRFEDGGTDAPHS